MAYTTVDKIKSMFRKIKIEDDTGTEANNTAITTEEVDQFIIDADAWIDNVLAPYYVLPITGTESLKILDTISRYRVAHTIKGILELTKQVSDKVQDVQGNLLKQSEVMLNKLIPHYDCKCKKWIDAEAPLQDATQKPTPPINSSLFSSSSNTATFTKGGNNW